MSELVRIYNEYDWGKYPVEVRAAWLHHAFTQIHPFQDGNGRVARALASLVLIKGGLPALTVVRTMKQRYIQSLEEEDRGRPEGMLEFFESCLYRQLVSLWREIRMAVNGALPSDPTLEDILDFAKKKLMQRVGASPVEWASANGNMQKLRPVASTTLGLFADRLTDTLRPVDPRFFARWVPGEVRNKISLAAAENWGDETLANGYQMEMEALFIVADVESQISITFDPLSKFGKGLCGVTLGFTDRGSTQAIQPSFFHNFKQPLPEARFKLWLDEGLKRVLILWQEQDSL